MSDDVIARLRGDLDDAHLVIGQQQVALRRMQSVIESLERQIAALMTENAPDAEHSTRAEDVEP